MLTQNNLNVLLGYFSTSLFLFVILELIYSHIKKDKLVSFREVGSNMSNAVFMRILLSGVSISLFIVVYRLIVKNVGSIVPINFYEFSILNFIFAVMILDLTWYFLHRYRHHNKFLWAFHFVHHSDDHLNTSTNFRYSWVDKIFFLSLVSVPLCLLKFSSGMILASYAFASAYTAITHSPYIKFPGFINYIFISPQLHRIHHTNDGLNTKNFALVFSVWDRLFGTYTEKLDTFTPGIKGYHEHNFFKVQWDPIKKYIFKK